MTSLSIRKHAGTGAASDQPAVAEPSYAERARTLMYLGRIGSLSTLSRKQPGFPFGSVMPRTCRRTLEQACLSHRMTPAVIRSDHPGSRW